MRKLFGTIILVLNAYLLNACTGTQLPPPNTATTEADMQRYHAFAQQIVLDPDQVQKRSLALDAQDYVSWAKQCSNEQERQAYLQKAYDTLKKISN